MLSCQSKNRLRTNTLPRPAGLHAVCGNLRQSHERSKHVGEVRCAQPGDRVPSRGSRESFSTTSRVGTIRDIVERMLELRRIQLRDKHINANVNQLQLCLGNCLPLG